MIKCYICGENEATHIAAKDTEVCRQCYMDIEGSRAIEDERYLEIAQTPKGDCHVCGEELEHGNCTHCDIIGERP